MKKNPSFLIYLLLITGAFLVVASSCKKDVENGNTIEKDKVSGFVQKGPFINGTQILMSELNASLEQTGKVFSTQISNSLGSFEISDVQLSSSFVEFTATGFYFDEVKNDISSAPLTLHAISDIEDISTINVNILTHLEKRRVEFLVKENNISFEDAKQTAQTEVLAAFGISTEEMQASETLNISVDDNDNAILLAISLIVQGNRNVGQLSELLALISSDLRENGVIDNEEVLNDLRTSTLALELSAIRANLVARYQALNVPASIPDFESYIAVFLEYTPQSPTTVSTDASEIKAFSATLNGFVNANSSVTMVSFEYGTTYEFGNLISAEQSPISGITPIAVSAVVTDLQHNTNYYFRIICDYEDGTTISDTNSFTTQNGIVSLSTIVNIVTANSALSGGNITSDGGAEITSRGVVWSLDQEPTLEDNYTVDGSGTGSFSSAINGLTENIHYYVRAYATSAIGTSYGNERIFYTFDCGELVTDFDNNTYNTILIGNQCWMKENLKTTTYRNGTPIPNVTNINEWENLFSGAYVWYDNDINWKDSYGALYNWHAVKNNNDLCPDGWHVPSDNEWTKLTDYLGGESVAGGKLKATGTIEAGTGLWFAPNTGATNETNFTALPGGALGYFMEFGSLGSYGYWWSATEASTIYAFGRNVGYDDSDLNRRGNLKETGISVRCLRD